MLVGSGCPVDPEERADLEERLRAGESPAEEIECALQDVPHYQVAVSSRTAEDLGIGIGQRMLIRPDPADLMFFGPSGNDLDFRGVMSISGIITLDEPSDEYWYGDPWLHQPRIRQNPDFRIISAAGLIAADDYGSMLTTMRQAGRDHVWRYFVDPALAQGADIDVLQADLAPFEARFTSSSARPNEYRVITQLADLLAAHQEQRTQTVALLSLSAAGLLTVVAAVILLLGTLMTERRTTQIVLTRNRGSSVSQLTLTRLYETLIITVPAGAIGYLAASLALAGTDDLMPYRATVVVVAVSTAVIVAAGVPLFSRRLGALQTERARQSKTSSLRRVVVEVVMVVLAAGAVVLLRRRGQIVDGGRSEFDLLLAATPTLLGIAGGLMILRIYAPVVRILAGLGARARGLVPFVGLRRILRQSIGARLSLLAVILCVATAAHASVTRSSIEHGQLASSWQTVGADYAVRGFADGVNLPSSIDLNGLESHGSLALGREYPSTKIEIDSGSTNAQILAIEADAHASLTGGTPADVSLSASLLAQPGSGTEARPFSAIVSRVWPSDVSPGMGETFTLDLGRLQPVVKVVGIRDDYPGLTTGRPFVAIDHGMLQSMTEQPLLPTVAFVDAPLSSGKAIEAALHAQSPTARLTSRYSVLDSVARDPFVEWSALALRVVFVFAVALAVIAAVSSLALTTSTRKRDYGYLRTVGLDTGQATSMTIVEQLPAVVLGAVAGIVIGIGSALLLGPAIDLGAFTGDVLATPITVDWVAVGILAVSLIGAMTAAVVISVLITRRANLGRILRVGEE